MKKKLFLIYLCVIFSLFSDETEEKSEIQLPPWKEARENYNLGTLQLSQNNPEKALMFFEKVNPNDLLLPLFGEYFLRNLGIAYLQYAEELKKENNLPPSLQGAYLRHSLKAFELVKFKEGEILAQKLLNQLLESQKELLKKEPDAPAKALQHSIDNAVQAMESLLFSTHFNQINHKKQDKPKSRQNFSQHLIQQHRKTMTLADTFIPLVLQQQEKESNSSCQQAPWDEVIPLFDKGYNYAIINERLLAQPILLFSEMIANQEQLLRHWQRALNLLLNPPKKVNSSTSLEQKEEMIRKIQEMHQQDIPDQPPSSEAWHTW